MKKDIEIPKVTGVFVAIAREPEEDGDFSWRAYLINSNDFDLHNVIVASKGYGESNGEPQKTSTLRQLIEKVEANTSVLIERVDPAVFHLVNEFWVSYYLEPISGGQIFDKRFTFLPESIVEQNITFIPQLELEGVLHD
jgi:hypothetical protein